MVPASDGVQSVPPTIPACADDSALPIAFLIRQRTSRRADSIRREDGEALIKRVLLDIAGTAFDDLATRARVAMARQ